MNIPEFSFNERDKELLLIIKNECSNDCIFCTTRLCHGNRRFQLDTKDSVLRIIDSFSRKGFDKIKFVAFEPLEHPDIIEIIYFAYRSGFRQIKMFTNGRRFNDYGFAKHIIESGLTYADILLLGHKPKIHDSITQRKGSFRETLKGIENLKKMNFNFDVHTVVLKQNCSYLFEILDFCKRNGISLKGYNFAEPSLANSGVYAGYACKMEDVLESIKKKKEDYPESYFDKISDSLIDYIPICIIKEYLPLTRITKDFEEQRKYFKKHRAKKRYKCRFSNQCRFGASCPGLFKQYLEVFGSEWLKPVRSNYD